MLTFGLQFAVERVPEVHVVLPAMVLRVLPQRFGVGAVGPVRKNG